MLLNFRKFTDLFAGLKSLTFLFLFYYSILVLLRIEFHNLFNFILYEVIMVSKKDYIIELMLDFVIVYFFNYIVNK
jgi:hypothetical protein